MQMKEIKDKGDKAKSADFGFSPKGQRMFEMMSTCCAGQGGFPDCSTMMKGMMEAMRSRPCCTPKTEDTEFDGSKK
ncbi:MAG: hypothetical protein ACHQ0Y_06380 [Thermodesulfovibrionales bacterium]